MATLYEINAAILECIDTETGEIIDCERLNALEVERQQKIENVALWYKNLLSDAEQYKAEKTAFAEKERIAKNKAESLKRWLDLALAGESYKSTRVNISYRASEQVIIDDIFKIDDSYIKYAEPTPDKAAIKKALKEGAKIDGAHIESKSNIQIK